MNVGDAAVGPYLVVLGADIATAEPLEDFAGALVIGADKADDAAIAIELGTILGHFVGPFGDAETAIARVKPDGFPLDDVIAEGVVLRDHHHADQLGFVEGVENDVVGPLGAPFAPGMFIAELFFADVGVAEAAAVAEVEGALADGAIGGNIVARERADVKLVAGGFSWLFGARRRWRIGGKLADLRVTG